MLGKFLWCFFFSNVTIFFTAFSLSAQSNNSAIAAADTTFFSINRDDTWQIYNSCASSSPLDTVKLEIIIQHDGPLNWQSSNYIGRIKNQNFWPFSLRTCKVDLLTMIFEVTVDSAGRCYLRLVSGNPPSREQVVVPVTVSFTK
jgi:hypothetical protein